MSEVYVENNKKTEERRLPVGLQEFETFILDLKNEYKDELPTSSDEDIKFAISSTIMHMGPRESHTTLEFFYKTIVAAASKQVAHYVFRDTKLKQEERAAAEKLAAEASNEQSV